MNALAALLACFTCLGGPGVLVVAKAVVVTQAGASPAEQHAARELRDHLEKITGAKIPLRAAGTEAAPGSIVVGQGPLARKLFPDVRWEQLGQEQTLIRSKNEVLLVAGGRPRGTLYAVYRLLSQKCGVRWWAPWATSIPKNPKLALPPMNWSETPGQESARVHGGMAGAVQRDEGVGSASD